MCMYYIIVYMYMYIRDGLVRLPVNEIAFRGPYMNDVETVFALIKIRSVYYFGVFKYWYTDRYTYV